jgi:hypothetical protein
MNGLVGEEREPDEAARRSLLPGSLVPVETLLNLC